MLNILIVDDEIPALRALEILINEADIGQKKTVFSACNTSEAKAVMESEDISLILCDIEMPGESGLKFLKWVADEYPQAKSIITSCYDSFQYAKEAMGYGCLDYLLKPVLPDELNRVLQKAVEMIEKEEHVRLNFNEEENDSGEEYVLLRNFWDEVAAGDYSSMGEIAARAEKMRVPFRENVRVVPIAIFFDRMGEEYRKIKNSLGNFIFRNMMQELILKSEHESVILGSETDYIIICVFEPGVCMSREELRERCLQLVSETKKHLGSSLSGYIGRKITAEKLHDELVELYNCHDRDVKCFEDVFIYHGVEKKGQEYRPFNRERWISMLLRGKCEKLTEEIKEYLDNGENSGITDSDGIKDFRVEFVQMISLATFQMGLDVGKISAGGRNLLDNPPKKLIQIREWCLQIVKIVDDMRREKEKDQDLVEKVREYITINRDKKVTRDDVAAAAGFNPEYLSRVFKKETGILLSDFIVSEKMNHAADILAETDIGISEIALQLGYENFSNFARAFKKVKGVSPSAYRKQKSHFLNS